MWLKDSKLFFFLFFSLLGFDFKFSSASGYITCTRRSEQGGVLHCAHMKHSRTDACGITTWHVAVWVRSSFLGIWLFLNVITALKEVVLFLNIIMYTVKSKLQKHLSKCRCSFKLVLFTTRRSISTVYKSLEILFAASTKIRLTTSFSNLCKVQNIH